MYRSAISASHLSVDGSSIGSHQLVSRFMKGINELRPPQPRAFTAWDIGTVLRYLKKFHSAGTLSLKMLTLKLVMLSAYFLLQNVLIYISLILSINILRTKLLFVVAGLVKGSRPKKSHLEICLLSFPEDPALCSFSYCQEYIRRTQTHRPDSSGKDLLFLSYIKPHKLVKVCTIGRWVKEVLSLLGINISQFSAHSTRSASTSTAFKSGVPISDIMNAADWTQAFQEVLPEANQEFLWTKNFASPNTLEIRKYGNEEDAL